MTTRPHNVDKSAHQRAAKAQRAEDARTHVKARMLVAYWTKHKHGDWRATDGRWFAADMCELTVELLNREIQATEPEAVFREAQRFLEKSR
jgi:hypothetical protein